MQEPRRDGEIAGRYVLVDRLGDEDASPEASVAAETSESVAGVWRVWDRKTGTYVAARVLPHAGARSLLRFVREAGDRLHHQHVVTPTGWAGEGDLVLFTMPLIRGGSTRRVATALGPLPAHWIAVVLDQVLAGLATAHDLDIVHGGIRASHVLLEPTGLHRPKARLSGWGLATDPGSPRDDLVAVAEMASRLLLGGAGPDGVGPEGVGPGGAGSESAGPVPDAPEAATRLWDVLEAMAGRGTDRPPRTARDARALLGDSGCVPMLWSDVPDEAVVDVIDRLPPYPPGWGPRGRMTIAAAGRRPPETHAQAHELPSPSPRQDAPLEPAASTTPATAGAAAPSAASAEWSDEPAPEFAGQELEPWPDPWDGPLDLDERPARGARRNVRLPRLRSPRPPSPNLRWPRLRWPALPRLGGPSARIGRLTPTGLARLRLVAVNALVIGAGMVLVAGVLFALG